MFVVCVTHDSRQVGLGDELPDSLSLDEACQKMRSVLSPTRWNIGGWQRRRRFYREHRG
jgi:hypothetical protein